MNGLYILLHSITLLIWTTALPVWAQTHSVDRLHYVLPFGDSLTQGVGRYESYRRPLHRLLQQRYPSLKIRLVGTRSGTCVVRQPQKLLPHPDPHSDGFEASMYHEGHCNWDTTQLAGALPAALRGLNAPRLDAALVLMGHNDIFAIARKCRLREGEGAENTACAQQYLRDKTKVNFETVFKILRSNYPGVALIVGLNPPTGFAVPTRMLHDVVRGVVSLYRSLDEGPVEIVAFDGFKTGEHTFDTTHPNDKGQLLMASAWLEGLAQVFLQPHHETQPVTAFTARGDSTEPPLVDQSGDSMSPFGDPPRGSREASSRPRAAVVDSGDGTYGLFAVVSVVVIGAVAVFGVPWYYATSVR